MSRRNSINRQAIFNLILTLEDMENKGGVSFKGEQPYHDLIDYFQGEYLIERAIEVTDYAIHQFSHLPAFYLKKAELLLQHKQAELALATLDMAEIVAPGFLDINLIRAEALAALDLCVEAIALLDALKADASNEELASIYVQEALIYHYQKEFEREFYMLKAALQEDPANGEALSRMWFCVESSRKSYAHP